MVMEALEGYSQMIRYEIMVSHSLNSIESSNVLYITIIVIHLYTGHLPHL